MLMAPVWLALNLLIEWRFFVPFLRAKMAKLFHTSSAAWMLQTEQGQLVEDMDVQHEKQRVDQALQRWTRATPIEDKLVLTNLRKSFLAKGNMCGGRRKTVHAVRGLSVGVPGGECFGLLGVNGAGKTTTMRMITGDTEVSSGDILVDGWSIRHKRDRARRQLGYCPQFDALPDKLTVWETVMLYARLRGVPWMQVNSVVNAMIQKMCLEAHKKTLCECLSGGNKRKLSTALSLIGQPKVVLLDEPSTGVDVGARRFLWEILSDITRSGHALVLTSHSMEECQVLCTRLAIMNFGQFACMGSPLQLRDKYGGGYTLTMKVNSTANAEADENERPGYKVQEFVREHIPEANLSEENVGLLRYRLASRSDAPCLAEAFRALEAETVEGGKLHGLMADYAASQTSLEEVFLHFSNQGPRESSGPSESSARGKCCNIMSQHRGSRLASDIEDNQLPEDDTSPPSVRGTPRGPLDDGRAKPVPL
jgi:ABC-type multidrug transport system ATPase subunit